MKKVCFILPNAFPVPAVKGGAVETLVESLIRENEKEKLVDITCVCIYDEEAYIKSKKYPNCKFIFIKKKMFGIFPVKKITKWTIFNRGLRKIGYSAEKVYDRIIYSKIKNQKYDAIFIEGGDLLGYPLVMSMPNTVKVGRIHGPMQANEAYGIYDYLIGVSNFIGKLLICKTVPSSKIKTLYNGVDITKFDKKVTIKDKKELREKYNISNNDQVLVYCGRVVPEKGVKELVSAFKLVLRKNPNVKLLIVGSASFKENITTSFEQELYELSKDILDNIEFTGFINNDDLYKVYSISDVSVIPSMVDEAFCLVAEEAMACSLPIIATDSGALPEIMDSSNCIFVKRDSHFVENYADEIIKLLSDSKKMIQMGKNSKKRAYKYTTDIFYKNFCNIIDEIAGE